MQSSLIASPTDHDVATSTVRIACVQGGDYWTTKRRLETDGAEFYNGQRYTIDAYERFVEPHASLIVSLDAPAYRHDEGRRWYRGVPRPWARRGVPQRVSEWLRAQQIIRALEEFDATHLIVRCNDLVGCELLKWAIRRDIPTGGILASRFGSEHRLSKQFCQLGNSPTIAFLANHNRAATASMVESGLNAEKALPWDYPPAVAPHDWAPKQLVTDDVPQILFAGRVCVEKGVFDLIAACALARQAGQPLKLVICGDGPSLPTVRQHPGVQEGWIECKGLMQNKHIHGVMRASAVTVVPSRHDFAEGLPLVIYESLAVRTPLVINDHPIFVQYFEDDSAIRFYRDSSPEALAAKLRQLLNDRTAYARLSVETAAVWETLRCPTTFVDVLARLAEAWELPAGDLI